MTRPTCIELFAGAGGASLGLHRAGFQALAHIEWDADACATLRAAAAAGLLDGDVVEGDVREVDWSRWPSPDLLWASPPCQRHSRAGNGTGIDGWPATVAAIHATGPRWVVVENVIGSPADDWAADLRAMGFVASVWLLRSSDYTVPQDRDRVFVVAGSDRVSPPQPVWPPPPASSIVPWGWLRAEGVGAVGRPTSSPAPTITGAGNCYWYATAPGRRTCTSTTSKGSGRRLSVAEGAGLQGFPAGYPFHGDSRSRWKQTGNAVPPPLAEAVARQVLAVLR